MTEQIVLRRRFRGPSDSANGGYTCGVLAGLLGCPAEVTLRLPPPIEVPLVVTRNGDGLTVTHGEAIVATARPATPQSEPPPFVELARARAVAPTAEEVLRHHAFPECFVCGPGRTKGDGLHLFSAQMDDGLYAGVLETDASIADTDGLVCPEFLWAALDCPSGWTAEQNNSTGRPILLGRLTGRVLARPPMGRPLVATARALGSEGRKHHASSAVHTAHGELLAHGEAVWIAIAR